MSRHREILRLLDAAEQHGCRVQPGSRHYRVYVPDGGIVVVASTPSVSGLRSARKLLRRAGVPV